MKVAVESQVAKDGTLVVFGDPKEGQLFTVPGGGYLEVTATKDRGIVVTPYNGGGRRVGMSLPVAVLR